MNNQDFSKYVLNDEHCDIDWQRQRAAINERIAERTVQARRRIWRWAYVAAAMAAIVMVTWFGTYLASEYRVRTMDVAQFEQDVDDIIAGRLPDELYVVNGWTNVEITDWQTTPDAYDPFEDVGNENGGNEEEAL